MKNNPQELIELKLQLSKIDSYLADQSLEKAKLSISRLEANHANHPGFILRKANTLFADKKYRACLRTVSSYKNHWSIYDYCLITAKSHFRLGDHQQAKKTYQHLISIKPNKVASHLALSNVHIHLKEYDEADNILNYLIEKGQGGITAALQQLEILTKQKKWKALKLKSKTTLEHWPSSLKALEHHILSLTREKQFDQAIELLDHKAVGLKNSIEFQKLFATTLIESGRIESAKTQLLSLHAQHPTSLIPIYGFARISRIQAKKAQNELWTGERYVPEIGMEQTIMADHYNRYHVASKFVKGKKVLDIACGEGYGSHLLSKYAEKVIGVDIHKETIARAKEKYSLPNLNYIEGSCLSIPLESKSVDIVVSFETIEHLSEHNLMIEEIKRVLKPDGVLILSSPEKKQYSDEIDYDNSYHVKELYLQELTELLDNNFKHKEILGQKQVYGSLIAPLTITTLDSFELVQNRSENRTSKNQDDILNAKTTLTEPVYYFAIASDAALPEMNFSSILEINEEHNPMIHYLKSGFKALQSEVTNFHKKTAKPLASSKGPNNIETNKVSLNTARQLISSREYLPAINFLVEEQKSNPNFLPFHTNLVIAYIKNGQYIKANDAIEAAKLRFPNEVNFSISKANVLALTGDHHSAKILLQSLKAQGKLDNSAEELLLKVNKHLGKSRYEQDGITTQNNHDFINEEKFIAAYNRGLQATDNQDYKWHWRIHMGLWAATNAAKLEGDFVECGVNRGFLSSAIMEHLDWNKQDKKFYLIDTYKGIDESLITNKEREQGILEKNKKLLDNGFYTDNINEVKKNFSEWENALVIEGSIPSILKKVNPENVCFLHIDLNCAEPEIESIEYFWDKIVKGGFVLLDDYGGVGFQEQKQAMDRFAQQKNISIASLPTGQGLILKH